MSIDETTTPTLPSHHLFIIRELVRRNVEVVSLAPRFIGEFEKLGGRAATDFQQLSGVVGSALRLFVKAVEFCERLVGERVFRVDGERFLESGFTIGIAFCGEFENAEADPQIERPRCGPGVALQCFNRLVFALGLANGAFAVAAISSMMALAVAGRGGREAHRGMRGERLRAIDADDLARTGEQDVPPRVATGAEQSGIAFRMARGQPDQVGRAGPAFDKGG